MSQSIIVFGRASSAAKRAAKVFQKKRQQEENEHAASQLVSQRQLQSQRQQRKSQWRRQSARCDVASRGQSPPATRQALPQPPYGGLNGMRVVPNDEYFGTGRSERASDPAITRPTFDVYDTDSRQKQGLGALERALGKAEVCRFRSGRQNPEDLYSDLVHYVRLKEEILLHGPISDELQEALDDVFDAVEVQSLAAGQPQIKKDQIGYENPPCTAVRCGNPKAINN